MTVDEQILLELVKLNKHMSELLCLQKLQAMKNASKQKLSDDSGMGQLAARCKLEEQSSVDDLRVLATGTN